MIITLLLFDNILAVKGLSVQSLLLSMVIFIPKQLQTTYMYMHCWKV